MEEAKLPERHYLHFRPALRSGFRHQFRSHRQREHGLTIQAMIVQVEIMCRIEFSNELKNSCIARPDRVADQWFSATRLRGQLWKCGPADYDLGFAAPAILNFFLHT